MAGGHERKYVKEFKYSDDKNYIKVVGEDSLLHVSKVGSKKTLCGMKVKKQMDGKDWMMYPCHNCTI